MRQTSEQFMEEMLKDNQPVINKADDMLAGFESKMADMIDQRIEAALSQFKAEVEKVNVPDQEESVPETPTEVPQEEPAAEE